MAFIWAGYHWKADFSRMSSFQATVPESWLIAVWMGIAWGHCKKCATMCQVPALCETLRKRFPSLALPLPAGSSFFLLFNRSIPGCRWLGTWVFLLLDLAYKDHYPLLKVSFCFKHFSKGTWWDLGGIEESWYRPFWGNQATGKLAPVLWLYCHLLPRVFLCYWKKLVAHWASEKQGLKRILLPSPQASESLGTDPRGSASRVLCVGFREVLEPSSSVCIWTEVAAVWLCRSTVLIFKQHRPGTPFLLLRFWEKGGGRCSLLCSLIVLLAFCLSPVSS